MSESERPPVEPLSDLTWARVEQRVWRELDSETTSVVSSPSRMHTSWWLAAPVAVAAILFIVLFRRAPDHTTHDGPTRVVSDVSSSSISFSDAHITLDADSAIVMDAHDDAPIVLVERGAAWFAVEPRQSRPPFLVIAGDTRIRVIGTRFRVARDAERIEVIVDHGLVEVGYHGELTRITDGEHWTTATQTAVAAPDASDPQPGPVVPVTVPPKARPSNLVALPTPTHPIADRDATRFTELTRIEVTEPDAAITGYLALSKGSGRWAPIALYAAVRLATDRGDPRARTLTEIYLRRFPSGANADDARQLLGRLQGDHR